MTYPKIERIVNYDMIGLGGSVKVVAHISHNGQMHYEDITANDGLARLYKLMEAIARLAKEESPKRMLKRFQVEINEAVT